MPWMLIVVQISLAENSFCLKTCKLYTVPFGNDEYCCNEFQLVLMAKHAQREFHLKILVEVQSLIDFNI